MAKKIVKRIKHVPQRTCVGCRETLAKRVLIRVVRTPQGLQIDPTGKLTGRGAYLHNQRSCWERGIKGALAHALKVEFTAADRIMIQEFLATLPEEESLPPAEHVSPESLAQEDEPQQTEFGTFGKMAQ